jgi:diguanylate cyclase (GGDEF)-like protein
MELTSILLLVLLVAALAAGLRAWRAARRSEARADAEAVERRRAESRLSELEARLSELEDKAARLREERDRARADVRSREADLERRTGELEGRVDERERALADERSRRSRAEQRQAIERDWNEELRTKLAELQAKHHPLGDTSDVRLLVLRTALELLGAEKGLLLSREDEDSDGDLDMFCAEGFESDPEESAIAQHFARQVLARDETVRADHPGELDLVGRTAADDEIENLVAIPIYIRDRFSGVVVCANKPGGFTEYDDDVLLALGDHAGTVMQNARLRGDIRRSYLAIVHMLADAIGVKDRTLRGHSNEVSGYVAHVADQIGLDPRRREQLVFASLLHDIGKLGISERILLKPAPLSPEEREIVQLHPRIGARLIEQIPALRAIAPAILHHHERWDGEGYPARLGGKDIPLEARVLAVADAFCAMTSDRPYREKLSLDEACDELRRCAGSQFDAAITRLFVEEIKRRPPDSRPSDALLAALVDGELAARGPERESLLGFEAFSAVDNLTLLYSHRYLHELADAEAQRAQRLERPFAAIMVELVDLLEINRERGYAAGDEAIRAVADAVQRVAGRCAGTAARESGGRICLLVPGADEAIAEQLADDISVELKDQQPVRVRVASWHEGDSGEAVLTRARARLVPDRALADTATT